MENNIAKKPEFIGKQENHNCQQFYGPVSGCVFAMPGSTVQMPGSNNTEAKSDPIEEDFVEEKRRPGPRKKDLFETERGKKDEKRSQEEAARFKKYVSDHHIGRDVFDSSPNSKLNKVLGYFCQRWAANRWIATRLNTAALDRFVREDCGMDCGVDAKAFGRAIRAIYESDKKDPEIYDLVATYFEK